MELCQGFGRRRDDAGQAAVLKGESHTVRREDAGDEVLALLGQRVRILDADPELERFTPKRDERIQEAGLVFDELPRHCDTAFPDPTFDLRGGSTDGQDVRSLP